MFWIAYKFYTSKFTYIQNHIFIFASTSMFFPQIKVFLLVVVHSTISQMSACKILSIPQLNQFAPTNLFTRCNIKIWESTILPLLSATKNTQTIYVGGAQQLCDFFHWWTSLIRQRVATRRTEVCKDPCPTKYFQPAWNVSPECCNIFFYSSSTCPNFAQTSSRFASHNPSSKLILFCLQVEIPTKANLVNFPNGLL